jgi:hypothetical protein
MKTMADISQRTKRDNRSGGQYGAGWHKKAASQRHQQEQAYTNQENKELVRRVIAKVSDL